MSGSKMWPHLNRWGYPVSRAVFVVYQQGFAYHIKDSYFSTVNDPKLMANKENGAYRPTYYCIKDPNTDLLWVVPLSTQLAKYERVYQQKVAKYGSCITIVFGKYDGRDAAFLLQNMFPIIESYIDHVHTRNGNPIPVHPSIQTSVEKSLKQILYIVKKYPSIVFTDVSRLESMMLAELALLQSQKQVAAAKAVGDVKPASPPSM